ncbi:MAG: helix-turn-helix domain-containing protein, partial [Evtepia sp.]
FTALSAANRTLLEMISAEIDFHSAVYRDQDTALSGLFDSCVNLIGKPIREMNKADRLRVMTLLKQNGALSYRRAMPYIAAHLGVSRYTIYKYLDEVTQIEKSKGMDSIESKCD